MSDKKYEIMQDKAYFQFVFPKLVKEMENIYETDIKIDHYVLVEIWGRVEKTLSSYNIPDPNEAKKASAVAFWIRKLKPLSYNGNVEIEDYYPYLNEVSGLLLSILIYYSPRSGRFKNMSILLSALKDDRVFKDLLRSYRYHSHSPHSSTFLFEVMLGNTKLQLK